MLARDGPALTSLVPSVHPIPTTPPGPFMKDVIPLLSTLPMREEQPGEGSIYPRPILYAAENDHKVSGGGGRGERGGWPVCWMGLGSLTSDGPYPHTDGGGGGGGAGGARGRVQGDGGQNMHQPRHHAQQRLGTCRLVVLSCVDPLDAPALPCPARHPHPCTDLLYSSPLPPPPLPPTHPPTHPNACACTIRWTASRTRGRWW
jgi:hypothetical protein